MFKSYIFASLYTVVGMTGWGAYSTISTEDTSLNTIKQIATDALSSGESKPLPKTLYRWKDHEGNWQYGQIPTSDINEINETYEKELALLRKLPREVLPTNSLVAAEKDDGIFANLNLSSLGNIFSSKETTETASGSQLGQMLQEVKNIQQTAKEREEYIHNIGK